MNNCFVIQPFDNDKFDQRYDDVFKSAIAAADLKPYRVDQDPTVLIPIENIERGIYDSSMCFAEITTNNPNVWYELGYAFACKKDVIMVCSDEREDKYPFDIQHKHVIKYKTNSPSDYTKLSENITMKIKALKEKSNTIKKLNETPVVDTQGLNSREIALLIFAMENTFSRDETVSVSHLQNSMRASGYRDIATGMGIRTLETKGMLEVLTETDHWNNGQEYTACRLTKTGETWMINNQDQIEFRQPKQPAQTVADDLPF